VDLDGFWALVAATRPAASTEDPVTAVEEQVGALRRQLSALSDADVAAYRTLLHEQLAQANDWRLWAAGYLAAGGMSDDSFDYFRLWLVHQGRESFEQVLADPDRLAELAWDDEGDAFGEAETLGYVATEVLEDRGGDPELGDSTAPDVAQPAGEPFDEDDDEWFAATFPRLWTRVSAQEESRGGHSVWDRITDADVAHLIDSDRRAKQPAVTGPIEPLLAAHLVERGHIHPDERPMLAAHWLAEGRDGEALLELASLRGHEPEVSDLWPLTLAELGVPLPTTPRAAMAWAAQRVLDGERDARWLVRTLWTTFDEVDQQDDFQRLILLLDDILDWTDHAIRSRSLEERERATHSLAAVSAAVAVMAMDDAAGALRILSDDR
jgi:hypothetical protein